MEGDFRLGKKITEYAVILELHGDLSKASEVELLGLYDWERGLEQDKRFLVINFSNVPYINSIGIAVLIRIVRALSKTGIRTFGYGLSPHYQKLFRMVGLTGYMMIYPDEYSILQRIERLQEDVSE